MERRGFTLIELLVVVSIIALLSSIVLVAVSDARAKGRNTERLQIIDQYRKALELARSTNGHYPPAPEYTCLGNPPSGVCATRPVSPTLVAALTPYLSTMPLAPAPANAPAADGLQYYTCPGPSACTTFPTSAYAIMWSMEGNVRCGPGELRGPYNSTFNLTPCIYVHK